MHHKTNKETDTNDDRVDVESWTRESERFKEKVPGETEKPNFEEQLRVLDAEISGKADIRCNREKVPMTRKLDSEVKRSAKQLDGKGGKADLDCQVEEFIMERDLGSKVMMSESKKEVTIGEDHTQGVGSGLLENGPNRRV